MTTMTEPVEIVTEGSTYLRREITGEIHLQMGHRVHQVANTVNDEAALR